MKRLILVISFIVIGVIAVAQPKSYQVTNTKVSSFNNELYKWEIEKEYTPVNMWLTLSGMNLSINGEEPTHIKITQEENKRTVDGDLILGYKGYDLKNNKQVSVDFHVLIETGQFTDVIIFFLNEKDGFAIQFKLKQ